jgi:tetratricopeptide (TPR) repeat protein
MSTSSRWAGRFPWVGALLLLGVLASALGGCASSANRAEPKAEDASPKTRAPRRAAPTSVEHPAAGALGEAKDRYARRHFIQGLTQARLGDTTAAVRHYQRALEAAPKAPALLSALADAQAAQGDFSTALYHARRARRFGDSTEARYPRRLARLYRQAGQPARAAETYRALLARFPDDRRVLRSLARLHTEAGRPRKALDAYERLGERSSLAPAVLTEMLALYRQTSDAAGIERTLQALIQQAPERNEHRRALARFYRQQERPQKAVAPLERALEHDPTDADAAALLTETYRAAGRPEKAAALEKRFRFDAATATADQLAGRARTRYQNDETETAERLLERALEKDSVHAEALALLGQLRFEDGAFAEAADVLERSLAQDPRAPTRWTRAAQAFLKAGRPARAATVAEEGLLLFPGRLPLLRAHATALMRDGQHAGAIRRFEEALRVMKADGLLDGTAHAERAARFHDALARLYDRQSAPDEARRHRQQARSLRKRLRTAVSD